jgi:putative FmdB family regulatory protein
MISGFIKYERGCTIPLYLYRCSCGRDFEERQGINSPPLAKCPYCGKTTTHRLITKIGGFILKGSWPGKDIARKESTDDTDR